MMIRLNFPGGGEGWTSDVEMVAVSREGEAVTGQDSAPYLVRHVVWTPFRTDDETWDVYVVLKRP